MMLKMQEPIGHIVLSRPVLSLLLYPQELIFVLGVFTSYDALFSDICLRHLNYLSCLKVLLFENILLLMVCYG